MKKLINIIFGTIFSLICSTVACGLLILLGFIDRPIEVPGCISVILVLGFFIYIFKGRDILSDEPKKRYYTKEELESRQPDLTNDEEIY